MRGRRTGWICGLVPLVLATALAAPAGAEQASSDVRSLHAGWLDAAQGHTCAVYVGGSLHCWGASGAGQLGYGNRNAVGSGAAPTPTIASAGAVPLGPGRTARAVALGSSHTCAILDDDSARCWGSGASGQLGYGNTNNVGDGAGPTPTIESAGPVPLGPGRTARAITAGGSHACAILDDGSVRCWGNNSFGQLGYGNRDPVGSGAGPTPTIGSAGAVPLGPGRTARAIAAGSFHTCAILDDSSVRCWGENGSGQLGYGNRNPVATGAGPTPTIVSAGAVPLGAGRTARAIAAGFTQTCAILDDFTARCWGSGGIGQLGYGNTNNVGDGSGPTPTIESAGPIFFGDGRTARSITAGDNITTCATLDDGTARCWGGSASGQLGYGNTNAVGNGAAPTPTIVSAGPVPLGAGNTARTIVATTFHSCAMLADGSARCWGFGGIGALGYGNTNSVGAGTAPTPTIVSAGPVPLDGALPATLADLALTIAAGPSTLPVGGQTTVNVTLANAGPDDDPSVSVAVQIPGFAVRGGTASQGSFDAGSGVWSVGTIPAGGQATLSVPATALAPGTVTAVAQVIGGGALDLAFAPADVFATDRATAQLTATAVSLADVVAPALTVAVPRRTTLRRLRRGGLTVSARPSESATVAFELLGRTRARRGRRRAAARDVVLASRSFGLSAARRTARLVPSSRRLGRRSRSFTLRVRITARDAAGNATVVTRSVRVTVGRARRARRR
jgi:alpha-tubulin suppressor-like RCC1 family protein